MNMFMVVLFFLNTQFLFGGIEELHEELKNINRALNDPIPQSGDENENLFNKIIKCAFLQERIATDKEKFKTELFTTITLPGDEKFFDSTQIKFDTLERQVRSRADSITKILNPLMEQKERSPFFQYLENQLNSNNEKEFQAAQLVITFILNNIKGSFLNRYIFPLQKKLTQILGERSKSEVL